MKVVVRSRRSKTDVQCNFDILSGHGDFIFHMVSYLSGHGDFIFDMVSYLSCHGDLISPHDELLSCHGDNETCKVYSLT
jgi:hypothetical protein